MNSFLQIKKISDLTRLCILPVMVLSIFLSFFLYIDMEKIQDKAQDLVDGAIPHISAAQQGAISLVQLRRNIETLSSSVDQQRCRLAYFQATAVLKDNILFNTPSLQFKRDELLVEVNRLWKQRILIDQLRSNVHNSLHYMDMLAFLIVSEQPDLFRDIDLKQGDYIDLYRTGIYNRDLKDIHHYYYSIFAERLSPSFNRKEFIDTHPYLDENNLNPENEPQLSFAKSNSLTNEQLLSQNQLKAQGHATGNSSTKRNEPALVNSKEQAVVDSLVGESIAQAEKQAYAEAQSIIEQGKANKNEEVLLGRNYGSAKSYSQRKEIVNEELNEDWLDKLLQEHGVMSSHKHTRYFSKYVDPDVLAIAAACHNALLLDYYAQELERFDPIWDIYLKQQREYSSDLMTIVRKLEALAEDFTYSELHSLHQELSDITYLASETKPMVMITIGFGLIGFWVVIYFLNRLIMQPLRIIARILIKFRYTKEVSLSRYEEFFKRQHLVEIREVIDVLPQIFEEFSHITESSNVLKKRYDELVTHSKYDALTRVFNRGSLNVLIKELDSNTPANFAILMMDIDFFKLLNDSMGHQRGDEVLFAVAQTIQHNLAKKDLVYRYGGEEFCVILSDVNQENAFKVADRLCRTIESLQLKNDGVVSGVVTVSVGLSLVTERPNQFRIEELINQADKALYEAKRGGRNRVHACDESIALSTQGIEVPENKKENASNANPTADDSTNDASLSDKSVPELDNNAKVLLSDKESLDDMVHAINNKHDLLAHEVQELVPSEGSFSIASYANTMSTQLDNDNDNAKDKASNSTSSLADNDEGTDKQSIRAKLGKFFYSIFQNKYKESDEEYFKRQKAEHDNYNNMPAYYYFLSNIKTKKEEQEALKAQQLKDELLKQRRERYKKKSSKPANTKRHSHSSKLNQAKGSKVHDGSEGTKSSINANLKKQDASKEMMERKNPAFLINTDYFNKIEGDGLKKSVKLTQDGSAYEFSLTASDLAKEVEYKKEYNEKLNEVLAENDPLYEQEQSIAKVKSVVVNDDGYAEISIVAAKDHHSQDPNVSRPAYVLLSGDAQDPDIAQGSPAEPASQAQPESYDTQAQSAQQGQSAEQDLQAQQASQDAQPSSEQDKLAEHK